MGKLILSAVCAALLVYLLSPYSPFQFLAVWGGQIMNTLFCFTLGVLIRVIYDDIRRAK